MTRSQRFSFLLIAVLLAAIGGLYINGCQTTSLVQKTTQARTAYTGAVRIVDRQLVNHEISIADYHKYIQPVRESAEAALNIMDATATNDPAQWQAAFATFSKALADLTATKSTVSPATQPQSSIQAFKPMQAGGLTPGDILALIAAAATLGQTLAAEGRSESTEKEMAELLQSRNDQKAATDQLDEDVARLDAEAAGEA